MNRRIPCSSPYAALVLVVSGLLSSAASRADGPSTSDPVFTPKELKTILSLSPLDRNKLIDPTNAYCSNPAARQFGKRLFFDKRLSKDADTACSTCHIPEKGWAGGRISGGKESARIRHTPSLWNVAYYRWYDWDGAADSLWAQCLGPIESPNELANTRIGIARMIQETPDLRGDYERIFGPIPDIVAPQRLPLSGRPVPEDRDDPDHRSWLSLTEAQRTAVNGIFVNVGKAIAAFESTIVSSDAPFDRFVEGLRGGDPRKLAAITAAAKRGLKLFLGEAKCVLCHSGPNFSDSEFHNLYLAGDDARDLGRWFGISRLRNEEFNFYSRFNDLGEGDAIPWVSYVVRAPTTKLQFKTPTLRNVMLSAPYMHTGEFATIEEVIEHYESIGESEGNDDRGESVLQSLALSQRQERDLIAFLATLTDDGFLTELNTYAVIDR